MGSHPSTKNGRQLRKAESRKDHLPQGRTHRLVTQYQVISPKNIHTQVTFYRLSRIYFIFRNNIQICVCMYKQ